MHAVRASALALGLLFTATALPAAARTGPDSFAPVVRAVLPAVVNIGVTESVAADAADPLAALPSELRRQLRKRRQEVQGAGSGFIIDPAGYIVTNNHVVGKADKIVVSLSDGTELPAHVVGVDPLTDVAVIRVQAGHPLPSVNFGDSRAVEVGDWVIAAGNPFGLGGSITAGIVSARGRNIGEGPFDDFIQIDAPINPGNSGGPVFNEDGQVVGMNTAIVSPTGGSVGIGFAIPSEILTRIVAELRRGGHVDRGWLGVSVQELPADAPRPARGHAGGVGVIDVDRTGPASRAGLRAGDIVLAVDGTPVDTASDLIKAVSSVAPGGSVRLTLRRSGRELDLSVAVGRRPNEQG